MNQNVSWKRILVGADPRWTLIRFFLIGFLAFIVFSRIFVPVRVNTAAMEPTINSGELVWVSALRYKISEPKINEIVAIQLAGKSVLHIARILAGPGDRFSVEEGQIFVNSNPIPNGSFYYEELKVGDFYKEVELAPNEYFVVGDNRNRNLELLHSEGAFGRVFKSRLLGKVLK